jgi:hypothetical protein
MKKVVKPKNLLTFRIWLEKLGYKVKMLADGKAFNFRFKKQYGLVTSELNGNALAMALGAEFEEHLKELKVV